MTNFIFAYHGGSMPETEEERAAVMAAWGKWFQDIAPALVDPGNPVGMSKTVHANGVDDNGGSNPLGGYTIVKADSIDAATELAKGCPSLANGGSVEVAEVIPVEL